MIFCGFSQWTKKGEILQSRGKQFTIFNFQFHDKNYFFYFFISWKKYYWVFFGEKKNNNNFSWIALNCTFLSDFILLCSGNKSCVTISLQVYMSRLMQFFNTLWLYLYCLFCKKDLKMAALKNNYFPYWNLDERKVDLRSFSWTCRIKSDFMKKKFAMILQKPMSYSHFMWLLCG